MKLRKRLPISKLNVKQWLNQRGQSLVEFVLLLAVISMLSYAFVAVMNRNIGNYWQHAVNLIINDRPGITTAKIE
jgi:competence protein ComGC